VIFESYFIKTFRLNLYIYIYTSVFDPLDERPNSIKYNRITSIKSPSVWMTTFSASLMNLTALLPQSRDISCYVSRPILAPPPLWLQKHTDLRANDFARCPDLWHQPRLANVACAWSWRLCGINPGIPYSMERSTCDVRIATDGEPLRWHCVPPDSQDAGPLFVRTSYRLVYHVYSLFLYLQTLLTFRN